MPLKNQSLTITYLAWDTFANNGKTGDAANHTLRGCGDGVEFTPAGTPAEVDPANLKGVYRLALLASELNYNYLTLGGVSTSAGVVIYPISFATERGVLPGAAAGTASGLPVLDGSGHLLVYSVSQGVTVASNLDKIGYALGPTQAFNNTGQTSALPAALTSAGLTAIATAVGSIDVSASTWTGTELPAALNQVLSILSIACANLWVEGALADTASTASTGLTLSSAFGGSGVADDDYAGQWLTFRSGANAAKSRLILSYKASTNRVTLAAPFPRPVAGTEIVAIGGGTN